MKAGEEGGPASSSRPSSPLRKVLAGPKQSQSRTQASRLPHGLLSGRSALRKFSPSPFLRAETLVVLEVISVPESHENTVDAFKHLLVDVNLYGIPVSSEEETH